MAAAADAGTAWLDILPRLGQGFQRDLESQTDSAFGKLRGKAAGLGKAMGIAIGGGLVAGGVGIAAAAGTIDEALDAIRIQTGKTGAELSGLEDVFRSVAGNSASSMDDVAQAVGELSSRTGQTGDGLAQLTDQITTMARITKSDLGETIAAQTRLFGDWSIATEDQADTLDLLFRASQATGVGVNQLAEGAVKFGGPMRQLGFSLEETVAILGKFEKEGVNTELVMGSMRIALGKMARAGEAPVATLSRVIEEIKGAGDAGQANALALELFGARAGPDMAAAIREGRFEIDELVRSIDQGDTIREAAKDTDGLAETFARLRNKVILGLEPIATKGLQVAEALAEKVVPIVSTAVSGLIGAFRDPGVTSSGWVGIIEQIGSTARRVFDIVREGVDILTAAFSGASTAGLEGWRAALAKVGDVARTVFDFLRANGKNVLTTIGVIVAAVVVPAFVSWAAATIAATWPIIALAAAVFGAIKLLQRFPQITKALGAAAEFVAEKFGEVADFARKIWPQVLEVVRHVVNVIVGLWKLWGDDLLRIAKTAWKQVANIVETAVDVIRGAIQFVLAIINGDWGKAWKALGGIVRAAWDFIFETVKNIGAQVANVVGALFDGARKVAGKVLDDIVEFFAKLPGRLVAVAGDVLGLLFKFWAAELRLVGKIVDEIVEFFAKLPARLVSAAGDLFGFVGRLAGKALDAVGDVVGDVVGFFRDLPRRLVSAAGDLFGFIGDRMADGRDAVWDVLGEVVDFFRELPGRVSSAAGNLFGWIFDRLADAKDGVWHLLEDIVGFFVGLPDRFLTAAGDLFGWIRDLFKDALNGVIRLWNDFELSIDVPDIIPGVPDKITISTPNIPYLHQGGIVPGVPGEDVLAMLQAGEQVIPADEVGSRSGRGRGGDNFNFDVVVNNMRAGARVETDLPIELRKQFYLLGRG